MQPQMRTVETSPLYAEAYNNIGVLHRDAGEIEKSIVAYGKCIALDPNRSVAAAPRKCNSRFGGCWTSSHMNGLWL